MRSLSRHRVLSFQSVSTNLFTMYVLFITHYLILTVHCHGNCKQQKATFGKLQLKRLYKVNVPLVGLIIINYVKLTSLHKAFCPVK